MPPKPANKKGGNQPSKKALQKKKTAAIEDLTFGLKNKNKSKVVQKFVQAVEKSVNNTGDKRQRQLEEQRAKAKAEQKLRKKAMEEERNALFGEALLAIKSKGTTSQKEGKLEAKGRDAEEDLKKPAQSRAMKMMFQMDAQEMEQKLKEDPNYVPTLEDEVEAQRQIKVAELKASGKGTPVTPETFAAWKEAKRKRQAEMDKKLVEAELKKKKGGKGLSILSGRALYEYKRDLFLDADAATDGLEFGDEDDDDNDYQSRPSLDEENDDASNHSYTDDQNHEGNRSDRIKNNYATRQNGHNVLSSTTANGDKKHSDGDDDVEGIELHTMKEALTDICDDNDDVEGI